VSTRFEAHGIAVDIPDGWEARSFRHPHGEPTLHLANFPLPPRDGEFGTQATERMRADGVFLALTEYRPDARLEPGKGLFAAGVPRALRADDFSERSLLRAHRGQLGVQRFFTAARRPFCLYVVAGSRAVVTRSASAVSACLRSLEVERLGAG